MRADTPTDTVTTPIKDVQNSASCHPVLRLMVFTKWFGANRIVIPVTIIIRSRLLLHQSTNFLL